MSFPSNGRVSLKPGTNLRCDLYKIISFVNDGGFGLVYKGKRNSDGKILAIKEFYPILASQENLLQVYRQENGKDLRFENDDEISGMIAREVVPISKLDHPNIVKLEELFYENNTYYIVQEWIEGKNLYDKFIVGDEELTKSIFEQLFFCVFSAIVHINKSGFVHRDINPKNIMITNSNRVVLLDFGLARPVGIGHTFLTKTAIAFPGCIAPEILQQKSHQEYWTDVFTFFSSLYWILTKKHYAEFKYANNEGFRLEFATDIVTLVHERKLDKLGWQIPDALVQALHYGLNENISEREKIFRPNFFEELGYDDEKIELIMKWPYSRPPIPMISRKETIFLEKLSDRHQRTILQSFDTARFHPTSLMQSDGNKLDVSIESKIGQARTEALISLLFGREIIIPAGQVADSPALITLFLEVIPQFLKIENQINNLFSLAGRPKWKPFRLALENNKWNSYIDYIKAYEYTGAPLVVLEHAGKANDIENKKKEIDYVKSLFINREFDKLGKINSNFPEYGAYAKLIYEYFASSESIVHARPGWKIDNTPYNQVLAKFIIDFEKIHEFDRTRNGLEEALSYKELFISIEEFLVEKNLVGLRGNWYEYSEKFDKAWPLYRGYLDYQLFIALAGQYEIDHPIFVSQPYEYGRFDHSLVLGPRIGGILSGNEEIDIVDFQNSDNVNWGNILELYTEPTFILSLVGLQNSYNSVRSTRNEYIERVREHGRLIDKLLNNDLGFNCQNGDLVAVKGGNVIRGGFLPEISDPMHFRKNEKFATMAREKFFKFGYPSLDVRQVTLDSLGKPITVGSDAAMKMIQYISKPYRYYVSSH